MEKIIEWIKEHYLKLISIVLVIIFLIISYRKHDPKDVTSGFVIFESLMSVLIFAGFWYEMHQQTKNQKTAELRNEMLAFLDAAIISDDVPEECEFRKIVNINLSKKTQMRTGIFWYIQYWNKIKQNNNEGLMNEFVMQRKINQILAIYSNRHLKKDHNAISHTIFSWYLHLEEGLVVFSGNDNQTEETFSYTPSDKEPKKIPELEEIYDRRMKIVFGTARGT